MCISARTQSRMLLKEHLPSAPVRRVATSPLVHPANAHALQCSKRGTHAVLTRLKAARTYHAKPGAGMQIVDSLQLQRNVRNASAPHTHPGHDTDRRVTARNNSLQSNDSYHFSGHGVQAHRVLGTSSTSAELSFSRQEPTAPSIPTHGPRKGHEGGPYHIRKWTFNKKKGGMINYSTSCNKTLSLLACRAARPDMPLAHVA